MHGFQTFFRGDFASKNLFHHTVFDVTQRLRPPSQIKQRHQPLARRHGAELFPTWTAGENVVEIGGRLARYTGTIPRLRPHVLADVRGRGLMIGFEFASLVLREE